MISEPEVRRQLIAYLKNSIPLAQFEDWVVSKSWNMHQDTDASVIDLMTDVELLLAEYSDSDRNIKNLREKLYEVLSRQITATLSANSPRFLSRPLTANSVAQVAHPAPA